MNLIETLLVAVGAVVLIYVGVRDMSTQRCFSSADCSSHGDTSSSSEENEQRNCRSSNHGSVPPLNQTNSPPLVHEQPPPRPGTSTPDHRRQSPRPGTSPPDHRRPPPRPGTSPPNRRRPPHIPEEHLPDHRRSSPCPGRSPPCSKSPPPHSRGSPQNPYGRDSVHHRSTTPRTSPNPSPAGGEGYCEVVQHFSGGRSATFNVKIGDFEPDCPPCHDAGPRNVRRRAACPPGQEIHTYCKPRDGCCTLTQKICGGVITSFVEAGQQVSSVPCGNGFSYSSGQGDQICVRGASLEASCVQTDWRVACD